MNQIYAIFLRQFLLIKRSIHRLLGIFYWAFLDLLLWGFLTVYLNRIGEDRLSVVTVLIGTVILWNFLVRVQQGVGVSFLEDVWSRNLMNLFSSPLKLWQYIAGLILVGTVGAFISIGVMALIAWFLFAYSFFPYGILMLPFIFILFFFGLALGIYATAMILRFGPSAELLAWSIPALIPPFSGVFYPVSTLPQWLQYVAFFLPSSHVFEGMRSVLLTGTADPKNLFLAAALSVIFSIGSIFLLYWAYRYVLRHGLLTRFQTE